MRKLSKKQGRIAKLAPPYDKITGADFKVLKKRKNNFFKNNLSKLQKQRINDRFTALKEIEKANNQLLI